MAEPLKCNEWPVLPTEVSREKVLQLPKWDMYLDNDVPKLKTSFSTSNFKTALTCLQRIGDIAERQNHHPDLHITGWNNVEVVIFTHSLGGLTDNDFILATNIDKEVLSSGTVYSKKFLKDYPQFETTGSSSTIPSSL